MSDIKNTKAAYKAFEAEVRDFVSTHCPQATKSLVALNKKIGQKELAQWQAILNKNGWGATGWETRFGGAGWNPAQRYVFETVTAEENCPLQYHHGLVQIGPVIMKYGSKAQQDKYLPRILSGEDWWCQGYSEPSSGSDLASLKTSAVKKHGRYVINGQKIWTSHAHEANLMYALIRTSKGDKKQHGISMMVIPMDLPGISVRPIKTIDGIHHVNEVFFQDVEVDEDALIGEEGKAWEYAKFLLERERLGGASAVPRLVRLFKQVCTLYRQAYRQDDVFGASVHLKLLEAQAEINGIQCMAIALINESMAGGFLGAKPSALRLAVTEITQRLTEIAVDLTSASGFIYFPNEMNSPAHNGEMNYWVQNHLYMRSKTIAGGTREVQKNVISKALLG